MTSSAYTLSKSEKVSIRRNFGRYVSQNILAMIGISCYVLVDTFFIAQAVGSEGITILNLCLPIYNFIAALGSMIGVGSAIEFAVHKAEGHEDKDLYFYNAFWFCLIIGFVTMFLGLFASKQILYVMGADEELALGGIQYMRTFMFFGPTLVVNYAINAFVRNDGEPTLAMASTVAGSLFNIVFDYIFMYPLGMGMFGAALATAFSPFVEIAICSVHFFKPTNNIKFLWKMPSLGRLFSACKVGVSSFIGEFAVGITTTIFNYMILRLSGHVGVAAYGIIANLSLVFVAIFNGISNGNQPLISTAFGKGRKEEYHFLLKLGLEIALLISVISYIIVIVCSEGIISAFNSDGSIQLHDYAKMGLIIYFFGCIFAGLNTVIASYFSAQREALPALIISLARGVVLIGFFAVVLGLMFGMNGVWASYPVAEGVTLIIAISFLIINARKDIKGKE
jgi:putative MATE family efflux protein